MVLNLSDWSAEQVAAYVRMTAPAVLEAIEAEVDPETRAGLVLAKALLTGHGFPANLTETPLALSQTRGNLTSEKGIGHELIAKFLHDIDGISDSSVKQQLATLKQSGEYAKIIAVVQAEIEAENREAMKAAEASRKAEEAAKAAAAKAEAESEAAAERAKAAREAEAKARVVREAQEAEAQANLAAKRAAEAAEKSKQFDAMRKATADRIEAEARR